jgi:hypothetical protein
MGYTRDLEGESHVAAVARERASAADKPPPALSPINPMGGIDFQRRGVAV